MRKKKRRLFSKKQPEIILGNVESVIENQLKMFYPKRLKDYRKGKMPVKIHIIDGGFDEDWFDQLKQQAGIINSACCIVPGFEQAILFLHEHMVDPL